jgi:Flp pilus assembly protein TadG
MTRRKWTNLKARSKSGSAAIEFALIAPVFLTLMFAVFEVGLGFLADMILANGVAEGARLIRTGQAQTQNLSASQFRTIICDKIKFMLSCDSSKLLIDVRSFSNFGGASFPDALDASGNLNPSLNAFQTGGSSQSSANNAIVLVRVFYTWKMLTPLLGQYFANMKNNTRLLSYSVAFRNEPY